jgi:hypothetical protein
MMNDTLPYLLMLIKKNIILHALVTSGSFHGVDLKNIDHEIIGKALQLNNFSLGKEDVFNIDFYVTKDLSGKKKDVITYLTLTTKESKYFEQAEYYFNDDENRGKNKHPLVKKERKHKKDLGIFKIFDGQIPPAFVTIKQNPTYGYAIFISFYSDFYEAYKRKKNVDDALEAGAQSFPDQVPGCN